MFKKGDRVKIVDWGSHYPGYELMAERLGATKWLRDEFELNYDKKNKYNYGKIVNYGNHHKYGNIVYLVDLGPSEILIDENGIELYEKNVKQYGIVKFMESIK